MFSWKLKKITAACLGLLCATLASYAKEAPVSLTTQDGWRLVAVYQAPQAGNKTVVLLHDLNKNKEVFTSLKASLTKNGFGYLALDLRGHGQSTGGGQARSFAKVGVDNQFNKMTRDVDAAIDFLKKKGITENKIALLGVGLGANVAAKSTTFWPNVSALGLISPTANVRDVLSIPPMRLYKGSVLIAAAAADKKMFLEASVIRNVAFVTHEEDSRQITFLTAYDLKSHEMLDKYLIPSVIQWLHTSQRPEVAATSPTYQQPLNTVPEPDTIELPVAPSKTEESLTPSILGE